MVEGKRYVFHWTYSREEGKTVEELGLILRDWNLKGERDVNQHLDHFLLQVEGPVYSQGMYLKCTPLQLSYHAKECTATLKC